MIINPFIFGASAAFDPSTIASLTAWWDFNDSATVTLSGSQVTQINDKVGSVNLTRPTASGPFIVTSGGVDWADFNGSTQVLYNTSASASGINFGSGSFTIAITLQSGSTSWGASTGLRVLNKGSNTQGRYALDLNRSTEGALRGFIHDGGSSRVAENDTNWNDDTPMVVLMVRDNAAGNFLLYVNGTQVASTGLTSLGDINESGTSGYFDDLILGAGVSGATTLTTFYEGMVGELLMFNAALSAGDRTNLTNYLANKWGV